MPDNTDIAKTSASTEPAQPVALGRRIASVDVLRGVALLGILVINIEFFALPSVIFFHPAMAGGFTGLNLWTFQFSSALFLMKMMAIFSMLFGAGLVLMWNRAEEAGRKLGGVYYRRIFWLLVFALMHAYLIWYGDILYTYAMTGLLLFLFRRRKPCTLVIWGVVFLVLGALIQFGSGYQFQAMRGAAAEVQQADSEGATIEPYKRQMAEAWDEIRPGMEPSENALAEDVAAYTGSFGDALERRAPESAMMQTQAFLFFMFWRVCGLMLLGMGLMKLGVFSAERTKKFYIVLGILGYAIGLPLSIASTNSMIANNFDIVHRFMYGNQLNYFGSILVALGHVSVVVLVCKAGVLSRVRGALAAVGQMALTNYLAQSIICTMIFYGYGLGLYNSFERFHLLWFVLGVWILQLLYSPWWLKRFRFGPAEWLWRSLTYWKRQPMRIAE